MTRFFAALGTVFLLLAFAGVARAQEVISSYLSAIDVAKDGTLTVTETIDATAEGDRIKRGIYRDFPLYALDDAGRRQKVDFELVSVARDGAAEPYRTETIDGGIRIYTGDKDVFLARGLHRFQITYTTARQIRFFDDHDELYWNVTGNGWAFPIEEAQARVTLPDGVKATALNVFTGAAGATDKNARAVEEGNAILFSTTRALSPGEGLTIAIKMPKGSIDRPAASQQNAWWLRDHMAAILSLAGMAIVALYYAGMWVKVGRDPARGVVVPRWDAPDGISPALVNYIDNKGFSGQGWTALSAAALNLAVSGLIRLDDLKSAIVLAATGKAAPPTLATGEATLLKAVTGAGGTLTIDKANGSAVQKAGADFRLAMEKEHRNKYYKANTAYIVGGVALSVLFLVAIVLFGNLDEENVAFVIVPAFLAPFVLIFTIVIGKALHRRRSLIARIFILVVVAIIGFALVSALSGVLAVLAFSAIEAHQLPLLCAIGGIVLVNLLFFYLMGAPTPLGARMMDGIDGLRQYLDLAEKDRMNLQGAPDMSPRHFETLLPYAVALGLEKPWSQTFDRWLATAAAGTAAYQPMWYHGNGFSSGSFGDRMGGFAGSLASTMTSSLPDPPKSSSSGFSSGGSSSGGGGGGGGGGGW